MTSTQTIIATLVATGLATSGAFLASKALDEDPKETAEVVETTEVVEPTSEEDDDTTRPRATQPNRAKIHTRNTLIGVAAANELFSDGGTGKKDRRKVILGTAVLNEVLRKEREPAPEDAPGS